MRDLLLFTVMTFVAAGAVSPQQDPLRVHHERAQSFQLAGDLERAEAEYRNEVLPRALRRLGNLSGAEGRVDESIELLDHAARLAPEDPEIKIDLAVSRLRKHEVAQAEELSRAVLSAAPSNARARSLFGRTRLLAGDFERAATELRKSLDEEARFETAFALALASLHLRRPETARALFDQMTVANASAGLRVLIGRAYLEAGEPGPADEQFGLALTRDPRASDAHYYRGLARLGGSAPDKVAQARLEFEAQLKLTPNHARARTALDRLVHGEAGAVATERDSVVIDVLPGAAAADETRRRELRVQLETVLEHAWHNLAVIHERRGEKEAAAEARGHAQRWTTGPEATSTSVSTEVEAAVKSAEQRLQAGDLDGAERAITSVIESRPDGAAAAMRVLGLIRAGQGRYDEAEALLRRAIAADAAQGGAMLALARAYLARHEFQRALAVMNETPARSQAAGAPLRARALLGAGRPGEARALLAEVAAQASADDAAALAEALIEQNLLDDAGVLLERVRGRVEPSTDLQVASARLSLRRNDPAGAEASLERALSIDAGSVDALRLLAEIASGRGDDGRAVDLLQRAVPRAPDSPLLFQQLAEAAARAARLEEALAAARRLNGLRPVDPDARRLLAVTLLQNQNWREAIEILEWPPGGAGHDARWDLALGMAYFGRRDYAAARTAFEGALSADPSLAEAHYHLGLIAREEGRTTDAIDAFSDAIARDPAHPSAHVGLGTVYLASGDLGRARRHLECAIALNPDDPAPHYQLALLFRRAGDDSSARRETQRFEEKRKKMLASPSGGVVKTRSRNGRC